MIKIVLDTNVLMSGIFWSGYPQKILNRWHDKKIQFILSAEIIEEYVRVGNILNKKYQSININPLLDLIVKRSKLVCQLSLSEKISRDSDDDKFIATALAGKCSIIVSGDKDLLDIKEYANIKILSPADFVKQYL